MAVKEGNAAMNGRRPGSYRSVLAARALSSCARAILRTRAMKTLLRRVGMMMLVAGVLPMEGLAQETERDSSGRPPDSAGLPPAATQPQPRADSSTVPPTGDAAAGTGTAVAQTGESGQ